MIFRAKTDSAPTLQGSFDVPEDASLSLVAFKGATGAPRLVVFADEEPERPGQALLRFRQVAMAPEVDVLIDGQRVLDAVPNAENQGSSPVGRHLPGGTDDLGGALGQPRGARPVRSGWSWRARGATSVYLIGSQDGPGSSLALVAENQSVAPQSLPGTAVAPPERRARRERVACSTSASTTHGRWPRPCP